MIIQMLIAIAILAGIYFYMQKSQHVEKDDPPSSVFDFYPSDKFDGKIDGYVFKMGDNGLGYYIDKDSL